MKVPTRFFLICLGFAVLAGAGSYAYQKYLTARLSAATSACEAESKLLVEASAPKDKEKEKPNSAKVVPESDLTPEQLQAIENAKARRRLAELEDKAAGKPTGENESWSMIFTGYVCEPSELATAGYDIEKISKAQQEVVAAYWGAESSEPIRFGVFWVSALLLFGIVPHAWYFLLRRLREVAASIRGEQ